MEDFTLTKENCPDKHIIHFLKQLEELIALTPIKYSDEFKSFFDKSGLKSDLKFINFSIWEESKRYYFGHCVGLDFKDAWDKFKENYFAIVNVKPTYTHKKAIEFYAIQPKKG